MQDDLAEFSTELYSIMQSGTQLGEQLKAGEASLARLLASEAFSQRILKDELFDTLTLYSHPDAGLRIYAHRHSAPKEGIPHDHGSSWAIYGTLDGVTEMTEWEVLQSRAEGKHLRATRTYEVGDGETKSYGPHVIHSTRHLTDTVVIRVTGTDLSQIPRFHFKKGRDEIIS